jgi:hypothetical protein
MCSEKSSFKCISYSLCESLECCFHGVENEKQIRCCLLFSWRKSNNANNPKLHSLVLSTVDADVVFLRFLFQNPKENFLDIWPLYNMHVFFERYNQYLLKTCIALRKVQSFFSKKMETTNLNVVTFLDYEVQTSAIGKRTFSSQRRHLGNSSQRDN